MENLIELLSSAAKIKTPSALAAIIIFVLYLVSKSILALDVFENIGGEQTYLFLLKLVDWLGWIAVLALFLSAVCYVFSLIPKKSLMVLQSTNNSDKKTDGGVIITAPIDNSTIITAPVTDSTINSNNYISHFPSNKKKKRVSIHQGNNL